MKLVITGELTSLNEFIKATNSHWKVGNKVKKQETRRVADEALVQRLKPVDLADYPVIITYRWYSKNARMDIDNVSFSKKFINDGLVAAGIIEDDSRKYVRGFIEEFHIDKENPRVEVMIEAMIE